MAKTNFAALTDEQYTAWGMAFWHHARNNAFISRYMGTGPNALIQHITELTKSKKGVRAVMTLLAYGVDFIAGAMGAKHFGASSRAAASRSLTRTRNEPGPSNSLDTK